MKQWFVLVLLAMTTSIQAEVICTNENTAINETTSSAEFIDNGDGTITHIRTGLMWMQCSLGQSWNGVDCSGTAVGYHRWHEALQLARDINNGISNADGDGAVGFAAETDWRLPNRNELESIVEERCSGPAINAAVFPNTISTTYWSSSPSTFSLLNIKKRWVISFGSGSVYEVEDSYIAERLIRLVRSVQ